MSKELALTKKQKALILGEASQAEISIAQRRASQIEVGLAARKFPAIMNRDGTPVLNKDGSQKYASEKGWTLKINTKTKELCGFSCREIDKVEDILLSDWILSVRKKTVRMCNNFTKGLTVLFVDEYENFKKRVDAVIYRSWHNFQQEMKELESV
jgi:hypothetical protein